MTNKIPNDRSSIDSFQVKNTSEEGVFELNGKKYRISVLSDSKTPLEYSKIENFDILARKILRFAYQNGSSYNLLPNKKGDSIRIDFERRQATRGKDTFSIEHLQNGAYDPFDSILKHLRKIKIEKEENSEKSSKRNTSSSKEIDSQNRKTSHEFIPNPPKNDGFTYGTISQGVNHPCVPTAFLNATKALSKNGEMLTRDELDENTREGILWKTRIDKKLQDQDHVIGSFIFPEELTDSRTKEITTIDSKIFRLNTREKKQRTLYEETHDGENLKNCYKRGLTSIQSNPKALSEQMVKNIIQETTEDMANGEIKAFMFMINHNCYALLISKDDSEQLTLDFYDSHETQFCDSSYVIRFSGENCLNQMANFVVDHLGHKLTNEQIQTYLTNLNTPSKKISHEEPEVHQRKNTTQPLTLELIPITEIIS